MACGGWMAAAVSAAARLGVADLLAEGPRSVEELAATTETSEPVLERVLRLLASLGVFAHTADGRYENSPDSERLRTDHPRSVRRFCQLAAGEYGRSFDELGYTLETGEPAFRKVFGGSVYDYMERTPEAGAVYDGAMEEIARPVGAELASRRDFSGVRTLVDVGGGRGTLARELLAAHPHLSATVLDRPDVCARTSSELRATEPQLAERIAFVGGDFFSGVPAGADLYLLKNVLHNWNDASSSRIVTRVREAMADRPEARLLVIEPLRSSGPPSVHEAMDDLMQVVVCEPGTTMRSEAGLAGLLEHGGLSIAGSERLPTGHSVVEAMLQVA
jgi:hypothetical protein